NGELTIVALQRDYLPPANRDDRETVVLALPRMFSVYDLRAGRLLRNTDRLELDLGPVEPVLLSLSEKLLAPPSIAGPGRARLGEIAEFQVRSNSPAEHGVIHLDVTDPEGGTIAHYSENLLIDGAVTTKVRLSPSMTKSGSGGSGPQICRAARPQRRSCRSIPDLRARGK